EYYNQTLELTDWSYSSAANRALHTAMILMRGLNVEPKTVKVTGELYSFWAESFMDFIRNLSEDNDRVMIVGHNPGFTSISNIFGNKPIDNLPTSGVVQMTFEVSSWKQINKGLTEIIVFPKLLY